MKKFPAFGFVLLSIFASISSCANSQYIIRTIPSSYSTPTHLVFTTSPSNSGVNVNFATQPVVVVKDASNNTVTNFNYYATIVIGTNPSSGTISGSTTVAFSSGVAVFTDLNISTAGTGYTLSATSSSYGPSVTAATSSAFNITSASPTYYVATTGNNANDGSIGSPWLTLAYGLTHGTHKGDTLYLRTGTYAGVVIETGFIESGTAWTAGNFTTVAGYPGETVNITNGSGGNIVKFQNNTIQYVLLQNLVFNGASAGGGQDAECVYVNADHIHFDHVTVKNSDNFGLGVSAGITDASVLYSRITGNGVAGVDGTWGHGLYITGTHGVYKYNEVDSNYGYGFHLYGSGSEVTYNEVSHNTVHGNGHSGNASAGILLSHGIGNIAFDNLIYDNLDVAMMTYSSADAAQFYNNTAFRNTTYCGTAQYYISNPSYINNICYGNGTDDIRDLGGSGGSVIDTTNYKLNPTFVNTGTTPPDLHIQTGSGAKNAGTTLSAVQVDYEDVARPQGASYDIGAYEYH
jgi:hypothetical protein